MLSLILCMALASTFALCMLGSAPKHTAQAPSAAGLGTISRLTNASEVAGLKLDADWVMMSAGSTGGAEALSGLARAFFYVGARSLLVSHWPAYSGAAVRQITGTFANLKDGVGRVEAHRLAMQALMHDATDPTNVHPSVWAPFVVVGEGSGK